MNCDQARDIILLTRPGETAETELRSLMEHLGDCPDCTALYLDAVALNENIAALRAVPPVLTDPGKLTQSIMQAVGHTHREHGSARVLSLARGNHRGYFSSLAPAMTFRLRLVSAAAAVLLIGTFLLQTATDAWKLAALEDRVDQAGFATSTAGLADPERFLQLIPPGEVRNNLLAIARSGRLPNFANEQDVQAYLAALEKTAGTPVPLPSWIELRQAVLEGRTAVLQSIDSLVTRGGTPR